LVAAAVFMAVVWAAAAVVFIAPQFVGIAVMALAITLSLQFVTHVRITAKVRTPHFVAKACPIWLRVPVVPQ
jgi:hypothetical protein